MKRWRILGAGLVMVLLVVLAVSSTVLGESNKPKGDYLPAHNFKLEIDGISSGGFKEVTGLESEVEIIEYRDGSDPITHKRPGKAKYKNIVLKLAPTDPTIKPLAAWYNEVTSGKATTKPMSIILVDSNGHEVARYNFYEAWPCRWKAPELNSSSDSYALEEIEFVVERVERQ